MWLRLLPSSTSLLITLPNYVPFKSPTKLGVIRFRVYHLFLIRLFDHSKRIEYLLSINFREGRRTILKNRKFDNICEKFNRNNLSSVSFVETNLSHKFTQSSAFSNRDQFRFSLLATNPLLNGRHLNKSYKYSCVFAFFSRGHGRCRVSFQRIRRFNLIWRRM